ncbi:MAG: prohibitin family protein [Methylacidiphilales bacterium]|nr:prohibitin family protein [Candidatus Methylacidiphilales bacterium]MDW8350079.1 prohibitin family protein [Verrucomicrobiae bacterium]
MHPRYISLITPILIVGVVLAFSCWKVVPPGTRGISVTLGKVDPVPRAEGLTFKKPFIEDIILFSVRQETVNGVADCFSSDLQTVKISYSVLFRVPPENVVRLYQNYAGDIFKSLIDPRVQNSIKQITALYKAEDLVKNRDKVKQDALLLVRESLSGLIEVVDIPLTNIALTDELQRAIELKQVMEQQALAKEYELQKAKKEAEITIVNARAEAEAVKIRGEALANSPRIIDLEIVKRWDGKAPSTVSVSQGGANVILPLR